MRVINSTQTPEWEWEGERGRNRPEALNGGLSSSVCNTTCLSAPPHQTLIGRSTDI